MVWPPSIPALPPTEIRMLATTYRRPRNVRIENVAEPEI